MKCCAIYHESIVAGQTSDAMMKVTLDILDTDICVRAYDDGYIQIDQKQICSGVLKGGRDTCQGGENNELCFLTIDL